MAKTDDLNITDTERIRREKIRLYRLGKTQLQSTKDKISKTKVGNAIPWNKGIPMSDEVKNKISLTKKGKPYGCIRTPEMRRRASEISRGDKCYNWKGGVTPINKLLRRSVEFKLWRESVFKRDNWTCVFCGERGGELHPDHIKRFSDYPELRFDINNGRTLCVDCHRKTDTWGNKKQLTI